MKFSLTCFFIVIQTGIILVTCQANITFTMENAISKGGFLLDMVNRVNANNSNITVNLKCAQQLNTLKSENPDVLLTMIDAWSKYPYTGFLEESRNDFGNYDECIKLEVGDSAAGKVLGKHCTYGWLFPDLTIENRTESIEKGWKLSYCVPDACTAQDLINATGLPIFNDVICSTKETDSTLDIGAIISLCIFVTVIFLMITSTFHDVYLYYNQKENKNIISNSFSIFNNGKKLVKVVKNSREQVLCFHGIKFISLWWIIAGHGALAWQNLPLMNGKWQAEWSKQRSSFYLMTGHLGVDSFFYISGFLLGYLYFKNEISKKPAWTQIKAIPSLVIHRYLRLTPTILMTYLFVVFLNKYIGDGPLFSYYANSLTTSCKKYWWAVFLYFQNYYIYNVKKEICITPLWFVCADMQLFLLAPLIIIPIAVLSRRSYKKAMAALIGINIFFIAVPIFTKLMWKSADPNFDEYDTQARLTDYFIGVMMGFYMRHEKHKTYRFKTRTNILLWVITLGVMVAVVLVTQESMLNFSYVARSLSLSFTRPVWCLGLCWITFACVNGRGGVVNWILSNNFMQFGGKLSFCLYLVHGPIIVDYAIAVKDRKLGTDWQMFYAWCGNFIVSTLIAIFCTLAFELPMVTLEKVIFGIETVKPKIINKEENSTEPQKTQHQKS